MPKNPNLFTVSIYGNLTPFEKNPLLSSARVRIFYKGLNRNRTFITDEFAGKLISSLPYTPVSGIWEEDGDDGDFSDHGKSREAGRIYGIVPEDPRVTWESHEDDDGVTREYACCDVVLFTTRYKHAADIVGKSQSMEIYDKSIKGQWIQLDDGRKAFKYTDGCFIGLQALGDDVEPCFEGAAFFTYAQSLKDMIEELKQYTVDNGGKSKMVINFNLSDDNKRSLIFHALNTKFDEANDWLCEYSICDIYDDYALVYKYEDRKYLRAYYTKDNDANTVTMGDMVETFIVDVTESELTALKTVQALNGGNFEQIDANYQSLINEKATLTQKVEEKDTEISGLNSKVDELQSTIDTSAETISGLNSKIETLNTDITAKDESITSINSELEGLKSFKAEIEKKEKEAEIAKFSMLDEAIIAQFNADIDNYTLKELHSALSTEYVNANANSVFSLNNPNPTADHLIPTDTDNNTQLSGAARLIQKHKNGGKE